MIFDVVTNKLFKALLDGTAKVGDSKKLGGKDANEYALAKDYLPLVPKQQTGNTANELVAIYENLHNEASDRSEYTATIFHNVSHPELGGGTWLLHGYRQAKLFGMQIAYSYLKVAVRFLAGTWGAWTIIATTADLANKLDKTGGTLAKAHGTPLTIHNTTSGNVFSFIQYMADNVELGRLGFNGVGVPTFRDVNAKYNVLHHDGNSAKVVFTQDSTTAPAADALWAHL